jgi:isopenicillin-N N-acyltransferase-like protein
MPLLTLPQYSFTGSPAEIGRQHGQQMKEQIRAFLDQRMRAAKVYLHERGIRDQGAFLSIGRKCLGTLKLWDADGWTEHCATADAAGVDAAELYTAGNMTDIRDVMSLNSKADAEGCSALLVPAQQSANHELMAAQTWDLNPTDIDFVVAIHRKPAGSPETWSITCAGCQSLIGMNDHGMAVGTTNIKTKDARIGIPYLSLLHRAIRCSTVHEAATVIEHAHRAAAHNFWLADRHGALELECSAHRAVHRPLHDVPIVHTNHCLDSSNQFIEGEPPSASSLARFARVTKMLGNSAQTIDSIKAIFADRSDGVDSVNRYAEDNQGTSTNACVIAIPARRELWACRGSSNKGAWVQLGFTK